MITKDQAILSLCNHVRNLPRVTHDDGQTGVNEGDEDVISGGDEVVNYRLNIFVSVRDDHEGVKKDRDYDIGLHELTLVKKLHSMTTVKPEFAIGLCRITALSRQQFMELIEVERSRYKVHEAGVVRNLFDEEYGIGGQCRLGHVLAKQLSRYHAFIKKNIDRIIAKEAELAKPGSVAVRLRRALNEVWNEKDILTIAGLDATIADIIPDFGTVEVATEQHDPDAPPVKETLLEELLDRVQGLDHKKARFAAQAWTDDGKINPAAATAQGIDKVLLDITIAACAVWDAARKVSV